MKDRFLKYHLGQHASDAPDIDSLIIVISAEENLRSTVPSSCYIFSQNYLIVRVVLLQRAYQPQIAQLHLTGLIDQDVGRLNIPMYQLSRMQVVNSINKLIEDIMLVYFLEDRVLECDAEIRLHEL